ncbi:TIGR04348 family glycosyltransferase [Schlegelella sp. S2-27]|uniref:TIGR04348 family glycosyltransferase n=1 Tax=Caldimonas mangrovi TaxID=2944811 RepID=A0ABT0YLK5_9BURK|nr:selenoneine biosynthesis selenosugar synthase SenB [Caldimonas mangrovi]MCM5679543.1 TIGR04348 family glycosyltransferase [Caldimonas mangrovi]
MSTSAAPSVVIVSPSLAQANNGNWRTAYRWSRFLGGHCRTRIVTEWTGEPCDLLIALHARRSAASLARHAAETPDAPRVLVLTGTDLYRDLPFDESARRSIQLASRLVVLQEAAVGQLPEDRRPHCVVIYQSAPRLAPAPTPRQRLRVVQVGHLRDEKDPLTFMLAAQRLGDRSDIRFEQIGEALDEMQRIAAQACAQTQPNYRWLGGMAHHLVRQRMRRAQVLVNSSRMEGGAQVIVEAVQCGTAVLASRVDGNVGMLGAGYDGYFELGDDVALARLIERCRDEPTFLAHLRGQGQQRSSLFEPDEERRHVLHLVHSLLSPFSR